MKKSIGKYLSPLLLVMFLVSGCVATQEIRPQLTFRDPGPIRLADLKQTDLEKLHTVLQETASYNTEQWTNAQTAITFKATPRPVIKSGEMICRSVVMTIVGGNEQTPFEITACRQGDLWQVQSTH
ncbi:MAG: hypothetical protein OEY01_13915 [Desulfobulbaceae bacterium]|nr:hypothetical protein [Desulfobulbaceae bacterium]HIJ79808.1 hypothetical protein [Deltaproteobacteria bacterium]